MNMAGLVVNFIRGRWNQFFGSLLILTTTAGSQIYASYSIRIKENLNLDQSSLNTLGSFKELGSSVGSFIGFTLNIFPAFMLLILGSLLNFWSHISLSTAINRKTVVHSQWKLNMHMFLGALSQKVMVSGASRSSQNFPCNRSLVKLLFRCFEGLSSNMLLLYYFFFFGEDSRQLLVFLAYVPSLASLVFSFVIYKRHPLVFEETEKQVLLSILRRSAIVGGTLVLLLILKMNLHFTMPFFILAGTVLSFALFLTVKPALKSQYLCSKCKMTSTVIADEQALPIFEKLKYIFSVKIMWLLLINIFSSGTMIAFENNLAQIATSYGYPAKKVSNFVLLMCVSRFFGSLLVGNLKSIQVSKINFIMGVTIMMILSSLASFLALAIEGRDFLYCVIIIEGFCMGVSWGLQFELLGEFYREEVQSILFSSAQIGGVIGNFLFSKYIIALIYDFQAKRQLGEKGVGGTALNCVGDECFRISLYVMAALTAASLVPCGFLWRTFLTVNEHLPTPLDATSEPPPLFDGTTRLYTNYACPFAQRVWITRNYKGLQDKIRLVPIDLQNRPAWYKEKVYNLNKVPALEHDGKIIGESLDLIKYVDSNFEGPSLLPNDPAKKEFAEEFIVFIDSLINMTVHKSFKGDTVKEAGPDFDHLENALHKFDDGPFFLGHEFSLVDIACIPLVERFQILFSTLWNYDITTGRPKLARWIKELNKIDAYKTTKEDPKVVLESYKAHISAQH